MIPRKALRQEGITKPGTFCPCGGRFTQGTKKRRAVRNTAPDPLTCNRCGSLPGVPPPPKHCQCGGTYVGEANKAATELLETGVALGETGIVSCRRCGNVEVGGIALKALLDPRFN